MRLISDGGASPKMSPNPVKADLFWPFTLWVIGSINIQNIRKHMYVILTDDN